MGRYYTGDIEGKFWLGVQPSDDADFFGGQPSEPNTLYYYFDGDGLPAIEVGIAKCVEALGEHKAKLDAFFSEEGGGYTGYNDEMVAKELHVLQPNVMPLLEWYARLELGEKIRDCVRQKGECEFEAEL